MTRCLFIFPNAPLSPNFSGGSSRHLNAYLALNQLGIQVHVLRIISKDVLERVSRFEAKHPDFQSKIRRQAIHWEDSVYIQPPVLYSHLQLLSQALFHPVDLTVPETRVLRYELMHIVDSVRPDIIWAETGTVGAIISALNIDLPWVLSHTDFQYRIQRARQAAKARKPYWSEQIYLWAMKRGEEEVVRKASSIITGSQTEALELKSLGGKNVNVVPTAYDPIAFSLPDKPPVEPARIFHLGSLCTTANYSGLLSYLEKAQPNLAGMQNGQDDGLFRLHVIGEIEGAKPALLEQLRVCGTRFYGHVDDLAIVLRPFDIVIIPYERDTGTRTKLPLLFNYAQVVVATHAAVAGSPEVRSGENCIILPNCRAFPEILFELVHDGQRRMQIGLNARRTFELEFTFDAQLPKYKQVLEQII